jgi:hypothetical protein
VNTLAAVANRIELAATSVATILVIVSICLLATVELLG